MIGHEALSAWESFYVIVGSSAAALTGLQFVVITLIADSEMRAGTSELAAFGTPTIVHFCVVLSVAAIISAPWPTLPEAAAALSITGVLGVGYTFITARRASRTQAYKPVLEDWIWHVILPFVSYIALVVGGILVALRDTPALFAVAASALLLLFIGIHNAWDTVTYVVTISRGRAQGAEGGADHPLPAPEGRPNDANAVTKVGSGV